VRLQSPQVEDTSISTKLKQNPYTAVLKGYQKNNGDKDTKKQWGEDTALFDTVSDAD